MDEERSRSLSAGQTRAGRGASRAGTWFGAALLVAMTACGTPGNEAEPAGEELVWEATSPVPAWPGYVAAAASGSTLVLFDSLQREDVGDRVLVARDVDGRWARLPAPGGPYLRIGLASAGDSVVAVGIVCEDEYCSSQSYEFSMLSDDLRSWTSLDVDARSDAGEASVRGVTGRHEVAVFYTSAGTFAVDADGAVTEVPDVVEGWPGYGCVGGSTLASFEVKMHDATGAGADGSLIKELVGVSRFELASGSGKWERGADAPAGVEAAEGAVCTGSGVLYVGPVLETSYDATEDRWEQQSADSAHAVLAGEWLSGGPSDSAVGPDGSLYVKTVGMERRIVKRAPDGTWSETEAHGDSLFATSEQVLVLPRGPGDVTVVR